MESSDNFDEFLKAQGINIVKRKLAPLANPTLTFSEDENGLWTMRFGKKRNIFWDRNENFIFQGRTRS